MFFKNNRYYIGELYLNSFNKDDFIFFCAGTDISKEWVEIAKEAGGIVIDNSSFYRMNNDIPLIVPEVNFQQYDLKNKIVSNPNCSTIQSVIVLNPLKKYGLKRVFFTTYQSVSGSGMKGINDLINTQRGNPNTFYPYNIKDTFIPQIDYILDSGFTKEEIKMVNETKKILNLPNLEVSATCVRVPIIYSHGVSIVVELDIECSLLEIREELKKQAGLIVLDSTDIPTTIHSSGNDSVYVGRIRKDLSNPKMFHLFCVADNIRKGAASNAVSIAEEIIKNYLTKGIA